MHLRNEEMMQSSEEVARKACESATSRVGRDLGMHGIIIRVVEAERRETHRFQAVLQKIAKLYPRGEAARVLADEALEISQND